MLVTADGHHRIRYRAVVLIGHNATLNAALAKATGEKFLSFTVIPETVKENQVPDWVPFLLASTCVQLSNTPLLGISTILVVLNVMSLGTLEPDYRRR